MRPLTLRIKLTLFYSITVSVLLIGFALVYYRVLSIGLAIRFASSLFLCAVSI